MVDEDHLVGVPGQGGEIVGGHEDGQVETLSDLVQHVHQVCLTLHIHAGEGLVQDQDVGQGLQGQGQQHTLQLAAGEGAHPLVDEVLAVDTLQTLQHLVPHGPAQAQKGGPLAHAAGEEVGNGHGIAGIKGGGLGDIADAGRLTVAHTGGGEGDNAVILPLAQNGFQEGGLACAVGADEGRQLAAVHVQIHILENFIAADPDGQILDAKAAGIAAGTAVVGSSHSRASFKVSMLWYMASK